MKWINYVFVIVIGVWFALMGLFNSAPVPFNYVFGKAEWPLVMIMLLAFVAGALFVLCISGFSAFFWRSRANALARRLEREQREADDAAVLAQFEAEVKQQ